jgi:hypothetical protein
VAQPRCELVVERLVQQQPVPERAIDRHVDVRHRVGARCQLGAQRLAAWRDEPRPRSGAVVLQVQANPLLSYLKTFIAGGLQSYRPSPGPFTPGTNGIGVIAETESDVYGLEPGQRVMLSPHVVANENVPEPAEALIGLTRRSRRRRYWRTGPTALWPSSRSPR